MESSTSRPVLLKAGIPLALTVAGFICARIIANRSVSPKQSSLEADDEEVSSLETNNCHKFRDENSFITLNSTCILPMEANVMPKKPELEEEISCLRSRLDGLQNREAKLEMQFIRYGELKEQESVVMELKNMLLLEMTRVEFMDREVSSMEAESQRLEKLVAEHVRVLVQLEDWKSENGLLKGKIKKPLRKGRKQSRIIREQDSMLVAREAEVLRINGALQTSKNVVKKLGDEIGELKMVLDQTQEEKRGILKKLELAEKSVSLIPKIEKEEAEIEDYNRLKNELHKLQKDREAELKELINLRWSNASGRENYDIMKIDFEGSKEIENCGVEHELAGMISEQIEPCFGIVSNNEACSKRRKLFQRLKRWVEGSDKGRRHEEVKCFARHSASDDALEHQHHLARRSCSSA